jgi:hypothetical protein
MCEIFLLDTYPVAGVVWAQFIEIPLPNRLREEGGLLIRASVIADFLVMDTAPC